MCDRSQDDDLKPSKRPIVKRSRMLVPGMCMKCKVTKPEISIRNSEFCGYVYTGYARFNLIYRSCFLTSTVNKFRSTLTKISDSSPGKLSVSVSGGRNSRVLLDLIFDFHLARNIRDKFGEIIIVHIDESSVIPENCFRDYISSLAQKYGAHAEIINIYDGFPGGREGFLGRLSDIQSLTAKEDFLMQTKQKLIFEISNNLECSFLAMGDSATRLAVKSVGYLSMGRGYSLPLDICHLADVNGVKVLRPIKDLLNKEIAIYSRKVGIEINSKLSLSTKMPVNSSFMRLTEGKQLKVYISIEIDDLDFVCGLDDEYPSTVSTINRTLRKLEFLADGDDFLNCPQCKMPAQQDSEKWRNSFTISKFNTDGEVYSEENDFKFEENGRRLCYSCLNNMRDWEYNASEAV